MIIVLRQMRNFSAISWRVLEVQMELLNKNTIKTNKCAGYSDWQTCHFAAGFQRTWIAVWLRSLTSNHKSNTSDMGLLHNTYLKCFQTPSDGQGERKQKNDIRICTL